MTENDKFSYSIYIYNKSSDDQNDNTNVILDFVSDQFDNLDDCKALMTKMFNMSDIRSIHQGDDTQRYVKMKIIKHIPTVVGECFDIPIENVFNGHFDNLDTICNLETKS